MFLKNLIAYSGASMLVQFMQLTQGFLLRRLLLPGAIGVWNYIGVTQGFAGTFDAGITAAAARDLPLLHGAKSEREATVRSVAFWARLFQSLVFAVGIAVWGLVQNARGRNMTLPVALAAGVLLIFAATNESLSTFCQSRQRFGTLGRSNMFGAALNLSLMPLGAWLAGVRGLVCGAVAAAILQAAQLFIRTSREGYPVRMVWSWKEVRELLRYGVPIRLVDYPLALFMIMDQLAVAKYADLAALGLYSTARVIFNMSVDIPSRMGNVYLARLYVQAGSGCDRKTIGAELKQFLRVQNLVTMPMVICAVWCFADLATNLWLPKYVGALPSVHILLSAIFFVPQTSLVRNFWLIDGRFKALAASNLFGLIAVSGSILAFIHGRGRHIEDVAAGMVVGLMGYYLALMATAGREVWGWKGACSVAICPFLGATFCGVSGIVGSYGARLLAISGRFHADIAASALMLAVLLPVTLLAGKSAGLWRFLKDGSFRRINT